MTSKTTTVTKGASPAKTTRVTKTTETKNGDATSKTTTVKKTTSVAGVTKTVGEAKTSAHPPKTTITKRPMDAKDGKPGKPATMATKTKPGSARPTSPPKGRPSSPKKTGEKKKEAEKAPTQDPSAPPVSETAVSPEERQEPHPPAVNDADLSHAQEQQEAPLQKTSEETRTTSFTETTEDGVTKTTVTQDLGVVTKGLIIKKTANIGHISDGFRDLWDSTLYECSSRLQVLFLQETSKVLDGVTEKFERLESQLDEGHMSYYQNFCLDILPNFEDGLNKKHEQKLDALLSFYRREIVDVMETTVDHKEIAFDASHEVNSEEQDYMVDGGAEHEAHSMDNIIGTLSGSIPETINTNTVTSTVGESTMGLNVVVNLSSRELSRVEVALLSKGLKFCPTPNELDVFALRKDINDFVRRIRLREFFYDPDAVDADFSETPAFRKKIILVSGKRSRNCYRGVRQSLGGRDLIFNQT
ncbi:predicted protein, partial [Nematostella vectensis]